VRREISLFPGRKGQRPGAVNDNDAAQGGPGHLSGGDWRPICVNTDGQNGGLGCPRDVGIKPSEGKGGSEIAGKD